MVLHHVMSDNIAKTCHIFLLKTVVKAFRLLYHKIKMLHSIEYLVTIRLPCYLRLEDAPEQVKCPVWRGPAESFVPG